MASAFSQRDICQRDPRFCARKLSVVQKIEAKKPFSVRHVFRRDGASITQTDIFTGKLVSSTIRSGSLPLTGVIETWKNEDD